MPTERLRYEIDVTGTRGAKKKMADFRRSTERETGGIIASVKRMGSSIHGIMTGVIVAGLAKATASAVRMGEELRVTEASFRRLTASIGQDAGKIEAAMRRGLGGAVSRLDMMRRANTAILLGIPVTARQMENLSRTALRLGRAVGRGPVEALGDLITGIGRMSPLILDNLGITIKAEEAFRDLGEGATDAEKRLAFFNAVMDKANDRSKTLGDVGAGANEEWAKLKATLADTAGVIGQTLEPAVSRLLESMNKVFSSNNTFFTEAETAFIRAGGTQADRNKRYARVLRGREQEDKSFLGGFTAPTFEPKKTITAADVTPELVAAVRADPFGALGGSNTTVEAMDRLREEIAKLEKTEAEAAAKREAEKRLLGAGTIAPLDVGLGRNSAGTRVTFDPVTATYGTAPVFQTGIRSELSGNETFTDALKRAAESDELDEFLENVKAGFEASTEDGIGTALGEVQQKLQTVLSQFGIAGRGVFGGLFSVASGVQGLGLFGLSSSTDVGQSFAKALQAAGFAGQIAGPIVGAIGLALDQPNSRERLAGSSLSELEAERDRLQNLIDSGELSYPNEQFARAQLENTKQEIAARNVDGGSQTFQSAARISEEQANLLLAVSETMRIQDAERNRILMSMDRKLGNIEVLTAVSGFGAVARFQGVG